MHLFFSRLTQESLLSDQFNHSIAHKFVELNALGGGENSVDQIFIVKIKYLIQYLRNGKSSH